MTISCPVCRSEDLRVVTAAREVEADDGTRLGYTDSLTECSKCGERFYTHEQAMASSRGRAGALRTHDHLLTPADIRALRRRYRLSQAALERLLGVGAKTAVRWERGTVCQSGAVDRLLRVLACYGPAALECTSVTIVDAAGPAFEPIPLAQGALMSTVVTASSRASGAWNSIQAYVTPTAAVENETVAQDSGDRQRVLAA